MTGTETLWVELVNAGGGFVTAVAAFVAAIAACRGLSLWKKQIDSDLARKLGTAVFQHRKSLLTITYPDVAAEEKELLDLAPDRHGPNYFIFQQRFRNTKKYLADVEALLAEAELRWGDKVKKSYKPVSAVETELMRRILATDETYCRRDDIEAIERVNKARDYLEDLVYRQECDAAVSINVAFEEINKFLKGKL